MKKIHALLPVVGLLLLVPMVYGQAPSDAAPASTASAAPMDPAKKAEIEKLLQVTGTSKLMTQAVDQMVSNFKEHNTGVPPEFWDRFEKEMNPQELIARLMPVYDKYYSLEDLKAANAFYATPAGQHMLMATPQVMHDSMQLGQDWGRGMALKLEEELKEEKSNSAPTSTPAPADSSAKGGG